MNVLGDWRPGMGWAELAHQPQAPGAIQHPGDCRESSREQAKAPAKQPVPAGPSASSLLSLSLSAKS